MPFFSAFLVSLRYSKFSFQNIKKTSYKHTNVVDDAGVHYCSWKVAEPSYMKIKRENYELPLFLPLCENFPFFPSFSPQLFMLEFISKTEFMVFIPFHNIHLTNIILPPFEKLVLSLGGKGKIAERKAERKHNQFVLE
jgi:hypothetical protein